MPRMTRIFEKTALALGLLVGVVMLSQVVLSRMDLGHEAAAPHALSELAASPVITVLLGRPEAPERVVAWLSPGCSWCRHWWSTDLPEITRRWVDSGRLAVEVRLVPEDQISVGMSAWVTCMREPDKAQGLAGIMSEQPPKSPETLDPQAWACAKHPEAQQAVLAAAEQDRSQWKIRGTPSFLVGHILVLGGLTPARLGKLLDENPSTRG